MNVLTIHLYSIIYAISLKNSQKTKDTIRKDGLKNNTKSSNKKSIIII